MRALLLLLILTTLGGSAAGQGPQPYDGFTLFAPNSGQRTYLMDLDGTMVHTWNTQNPPGLAVYLLANGNLLHSDRTVNGGTGGTGGGVSEIAWDGSVVWSMPFTSAQNGGLQHHDVEELPSGNILLIAWEAKTRAECLAAGRNPAYLANNSTFLPDMVLEVVRSGPSAGTIAWEWHAWDHLVQDFDATQANYGSVSGSPQLIDINYPPMRELSGDWLHVNGVKYNAVLDQIVISIHDLNEVWILDHSTTTAEASGHTGGNSGMGGDLLYRWGNPEAYQRGTQADAQLFGQHDAHWIEAGSPGEGNLLIFNNGIGRPGQQYSTVVEIITPVDAAGDYALVAGQAFGPTAPTWVYQANPPTSFFSSAISGAQRQPNGNTLICEGQTGLLFEVDPVGNTVWQYQNAQPSPQRSNVFKVRRYDRRLFSQPDTLSVSAGGQISFHIEAGTMRAGQTYFLVGSASGTSPGIFVGNGINLPLNVDPYLVYTAVNPNTAFLSQTLGTLDQEGASTAVLSLPAGGAPANLVGATFHHAYLVLDLAAGLATRASNAQAFSFTL